MQDPNNNTALDLAGLARYLNSQGRSARGAGTDTMGSPLCYGIGEATESLASLQENMLQLLEKRVLATQPTGQTWVCYGASLQRFAARLAGQEVNSIWVDPLLRAANEVGAEQPATMLPLVAAGLPGNCAGIVLEGTINYLDQLQVLQYARAHLSAGGRLLLLGENLLDDSVIAYSPLPNLASARALSARLGFELQAEDDLSAGAQLTLDKLLAGLGDDAQNRPELVSLYEAVQAIAAEYRAGRRTLRLFDWRWLPEQQDEYAAAEFADIDSFPPAEIADLFQRSFNVEFNPRLWHWKYQLGAGKCVVARAQPHSPIVAHYGGAPRRIHYFGQQATAIQVCDVMVLPQSRSQYGRSSLFFRTAATFLEREIGNSVRHLLGFGFPNQKAMNIAKRLGLYEKTDEFVELVMPPGETGWTVESLDPGIEASTIDRLWKSMAADFPDGIVGVRDSDYFRYRYCDHPYGQDGLYKLLRLVDDETQVVVVLKKQAEHWLVMDLIGARKNLAPALRCLAAWGRGALQEDALKFWVTRGYLDELRCADAIVNDLGIEIPCNSWNRGPAASVLAGKWWLTAGDMDFL